MSSLIKRPTGGMVTPPLCALLFARLFAMIFSLIFSLVGIMAFPSQVSAQGSTTGAVIDSLSPVFRKDSSEIRNIRNIEAGVAGQDSLRGLNLGRNDSLRQRLIRRGPYVGVSLGVAFAEHSARDRFTSVMNTRASTNDQRILQQQDPVHVFFPGGLLVGVPVLSHLDLMLRTQHFYYRVAGLAQKDNEAASEYWYTTQGHLAGVGLRGHVPVSFLTVSGKSGLYLDYTHYWNFGPTGIRSPDGSVSARFNPAGAGMEIQTGFQQDFAKRWAMTGGLSWSKLTFRSAADWTNVAPGVSAAGEKAEWTLSSLRFALQGVYQFGRAK